MGIDEETRWEVCEEHGEVKHHAMTAAERYFFACGACLMRAIASGFANMRGVEEISADDYQRIMLASHISEDSGDGQR